MKKIMVVNTPIYDIAKDLNIDSNRVILACKSLGINAKGATKRLNNEQVEKIKNYFETGKNASEEIIEINKSYTSQKNKTKNLKQEIQKSYFPNRLIAKS